MDYHIFKKSTKSKNKTIHRWYYYFVDVVSGKKIQRVCKGCKTQAEAYALFLLYRLFMNQPKSQLQKSQNGCMFLEVNIYNAKKN